jgi:hypothetical protein
MGLFRRPYLLAVLLHIAFFAVLALYQVPIRPRVPTADAGSRPESRAARSMPAAGYTAEKGPYAFRELQNKLSNCVAAAQVYSAAEQLGMAGDYAKQLETISSVTSMREIGAYLKSGGAPKPHSSLAERGREKTFDHASSTPVGAREVGSGRYVFIFKDANGNTCEWPAAPGEENAARALALLDRSDVLREFKNSVLLPALYQRLDPN